MATIDFKNISLARVRDVLNEAGGNASNNMASFFTKENINMWSKYKPVVSRTLFHEESVWRTSGYKGDNLQCGITIPRFYSRADFRNAVANNSDKWSYTPPKGGEYEPLRLGDFRGYCSHAENPIGGIVTNGIRMEDGLVEFNIDVVHTSGSETNITLSDIAFPEANGNLPLTDFYLGIYAYKESNGHFMFQTGSTPIGQADGLSTFIQFTETGTFKFVPFLSSRAQLDQGVDAVFVGLNYLPKAVTIMDASGVCVVSVSAIWNKTYTSVVMESMALVNNTGTPKTFTSVVISIMETDFGVENGASGSLKTTVSLTGNWTVQGGQSMLVTLNETRAVSYNPQKEYWVGAISNLNNAIGLWMQVEQNQDMID